MKRIGYGLANLILVFGLLVSACAAPKAAPAAIPSPAPQPIASPAPQLSGWDKVLAAASKEGTLTVYSTHGPDFDAALKAGMKQYGIRLETVGGSSGELEQKVLTEQRAKAYVADLFDAGPTNFPSIMTQGYAQPVNVALPSLAEKDVWRVNPQYEPTKSAHVIGMTISTSIIINTDLVGKGEVQSWQDLLDPKWRDRMVMTDPRTGTGPGASQVFVFMSLGEDFWKKMAAQRILMHANWDLPVTQVALGEKPLAVFLASSRVVVAIRAGAPIQIVNLKEGTSYSVQAMLFLNNAPHPNAAFVFLNWILSKEGQIAIGTAGGMPSLRKDIIPNWLSIRELDPRNFSLIEPASNIDPQAGKVGTAFANKIFGAR